MKRLLPLLALLFAPLAFAINPALGIHNLSAFIFPATTYTSPTGSNSAASGSSFVVVVAIESAQASTITDTFSNTYSLVSLTSGTNPIQDVSDGIPFLYIYACTTSCAGGTNHEVTVTNGGAKRMYWVAFVEITNTHTIDVSGSAYSPSGSPLNISLTPSVANDFLFAIASTGSGSSTITSGTGSGFTNLDSGANVSASIGDAYLAGATTSAQEAAMKGSNAGHKLVGFTLAFEPSGGGASCTSTAWVNGGTKAIPTASSTSLWLSTGAWGTTPCDGTGTSWWSTSGSFVTQ